ncbi:MAG: phosphomannomutase/phosphoglucomutase [Clostridia bacterium]|nr:phosphomannomutase/phosphoglucomutase [Clostridia bacterium]
MAYKKDKLPFRLGNNETISFMNDYCKILLNVVRRGTGKSSPLFGKKIVVDAGNGAGGFFVKKVLQQLGAVTDGSINLKPDGMFPAHAPNPEDPDAISALRNAVLNNRADLGVIFDTDVDRAALVDSSGKLLNRDTLIALVAATVLKERPATIVTDSVTSEGLAEFITSHGGKHVRYKRGYKNVIDEARRRNARGEYCPVAIETSGHAAFKENYFLDDGAYLVCKLLVTFANQSAKNETLYDLISDLHVPIEEKELRIGFNENSKNFKIEGARVIDELSYFAKVNTTAKLAPDNYEGVRISYPAGEGDGWSMTRMSVHDPVIVINFASRVLGGNRIMAKKLYYMLDKYPFLNIDNLTDFIIEEY